MVILDDEGVIYVDRSGITRTASRGGDISQEDYDAMGSWERYAVLRHFASQGDGPKRFDGREG